MNSSLSSLDFVLPATDPIPSLAIISDTHGLLRPEEMACLRGVDHILHAGDLGSIAVLRQMQTLAPVTVVAGNVDRGEWASQLPATASIALGGVVFFLIHDIADLSKYPAPPTTTVVVYGHSHKPAVSHRDGLVYLNPGSAGPRRFSLPVSLVLCRPQLDGWSFSFVDLLGDT